MTEKETQRYSVTGDLTEIARDYIELGVKDFSRIANHIFHLDVPSIIKPDKIRCYLPQEQMRALHFTLKDSFSPATLITVEGSLHGNVLSNCEFKGKRLSQLDYLGYYKPRTKEFATTYKMGRLQSDLAKIHNNLYVINALIQIKKHKGDVHKYGWYKTKSLDKYKVSLESNETLLQWSSVFGATETIVRTHAEYKQIFHNSIKELRAKQKEYREVINAEKQKNTVPDKVREF